MNEPLYFIPYLIDALEDSDVRASLKSVFLEITRKGLHSQYVTGFQNFIRFMDEACLRHQTIERHFSRELIVLLVSGYLEVASEENTAALNWLDSCSEWRAEKEAFLREAGEDSWQFLPPAIQILRGDHLIREVAMPRVGGREYIDGIVPGQYTVKLDIGMTIWEGALTAQDLLWSEAFEGRDLDMAAETKDRKQRPTREIVLLDGALNVRVFAGIESGSIEIELYE